MEGEAEGMGRRVPVGDTLGEAPALGEGEAVGVGVALGGGMTRVRGT